MPDWEPTAAIENDCPLFAEKMQCGGIAGAVPIAAPIVDAGRFKCSQVAKPVRSEAIAGQLTGTQCQLRDSMSDPGRGWAC
jgi:hypothetical protein